MEIKLNLPFIARPKSGNIFEMQKLAGTIPTFLNKLILRTFSCLPIQRLLLCDVKFCRCLATVFRNNERKINRIVHETHLELDSSKIKRAIWICSNLYESRLVYFRSDHCV